MKKAIIRVLALAVVLGAAWLGYRFFQQFKEKQAVIPTAKVLQGDVIIRSYTRGELRAVRSAMLIAPNLFGTVQITRLAPLGAFAREKNLIVEFDDSEVRSRLEEKELELEQLDEQLKKSQAELEMRSNQDKVELLRARYSVRRAELERQRNELLSKIDATRNELTLEEQRRRMTQLESDIKSRLDQAQAELAVLREKKNKANLEYAREKQRLRQVKLLAPMAGLVAVRQNRGMGMFFRGMQLPDLREGDQVYPGSPVADVLDLSELEVAAKVGELDRANLHEGQDVTIKLDAVPEKLFHGKIKNLSGTASANIWSGDPAKKFDVIFSVDMNELLTGLGARPEQIKKVLETAARNRNKPAAPQMPPAMMAMSGPGPMAGGAAVSPSGAGPGGGDAGSGGQGGERRTMRFGGGEGRPQMSPEQQQKLREAVQKILNGRNPRDLSPEEQQKVGEQIRALVQGQRGGQAAEAGGREGRRAAGGETARGEDRGQGRRGEGGESGRGGEGPRVVGFSRGGPGAGGSRGGAEGMPRMPMGFGGAEQFTEADIEHAKLPPPPEDSNQLEVLLRPGLLADVEIIVEKVANAIHIPAQAVFDQEGKPVVYIKTSAGFEPRAIQPLKRSESTMVVAGLKAGELVALSDPTARKGKKGEKQGGKKPGMPAPSAGAGAAGGGK